MVSGLIEAINFELPKKKRKMMNASEVPPMVVSSSDSSSESPARSSGRVLPREKLVDIYETFFKVQ